MRLSTFSALRRDLEQFRLAPLSQLKHDLNTSLISHDPTYSMRKKKRSTPKNEFGFLKISSSVNIDRIDNCF
jgi:hypothetical protein